MRISALATAIAALLAMPSVAHAAEEMSGEDIARLLLDRPVELLGSAAAAAEVGQPVELELEQERILAGSLAEIVELVRNYRYKRASELYSALLATVDPWAHQPHAARLLEGHRNILEYMAEQCALGQSILAQSTESSSADWVFGMELFGVTTHYRVDPASGIVSVKLAGELDDLPIAELVAVLYEVDLYKSWMPFISDSQRVHLGGPAEVLGYVLFSIPVSFMSRDTLFAAQGIDMLLEDGALVLSAKSCNGASVEQYVRSRAARLAVRGAAEECGGQEPHKEAPLKPSGWLHQQMEIIDFTAVLEPLSPTSMRCVLLLALDLRAHLPQVVINFLIKNLAGLFLSLLKSQVRKVAASEDNPHKRAIRSNAAFYRDWLLPKLQALFREKKWELEVPACLL